MENHIAAERSVIGGLIWSPECIDEVSKIICEADFLDRDLREVFGKIKQAANDNEATSDHLSIYLRERLEERQKPLVKEIIDNTVSANNVIAWSQIVREHSVQRQLRIGINPSDRERLALYFQELSAELTCGTITPAWVMDVIITVNEELTSLFRCAQENEEAIAKSGT